MCGQREVEVKVGQIVRKCGMISTALQSFSGLNASVSPVKAYGKHLRQFTQSDKSLLTEEHWF